MTSTTLLCPASIVQPFDQTYGTKEWIPRRRLIHTITPLPLSTMKAEGAHGKRREGGWRHDHQLSASRCFVTAAIEADVALQEAIAEAESSLETQTDDLEVLARVGLEAVTGKKSEKRDENLKQNSSRRLLEDKDVVAGAVFMGKVRSILSFGAFVDFGAFTDGLVHISQLSSAFVISVEDAVSVGQEVRVKILDVNFASKRIALSMKDLEDGGEQKRPTSEGSVRGVSGQTQGEGKGNSRGKTAGSVRGRQTEQKNKSNFKKGEQIDGVVKNLTRRGAFVTLPGGEEGFLPATEIPGGERTPLQNLVPAGKEVSVRVLKVGGGKVSLSLKPVLDLASVNKAVNRDVEIEGGNAFEIAFRSNPAIRKYLTDLEAKSSQLMEEKLSVDHTTAAEDAFREDPSTPLIADEGEADKEKAAVSASVNPLADKFYEEENAAVVDKTEKVQVKEKVALDETIEITTSAENIIPLFPEENALSLLEVAVMEDKIDEARSEVAADEEASMETECEIHSVAEETTVDTEERYLTSAKNITSNVEEAVVPSVAVMVATEGTESLVSDAAAVRSTAFPETESTIPPKNIELLPSLSIGAKKNAASSAVAASTLSSAAVAALKEESTLKSSESSGAINSALIKKLRAETGAGMMDCKKALIEMEGDLEEARDYLRKKGLASAEKKIGRIVAEGLIGNYIHDSRIGVLIEVNCETDFVSRGEIFKQLVEDLAMQVVANQQVDYVSVEDIPLEIQAKERELQMQREDLLNKPEQIRAKIVDGRLAKRFGELALLEQPFIKNDTLLVKDLVKQTVASLGENINIRRFVRYTLGEGLEKKSEDFATGVAAQTTGKEVF